MSGKCPFCEPSLDLHVFLEDECNIAVYNIAPILPGHSLIIPRQHLTSISGFTAQELGDFFLFARKVTSILTKAFQADGFDWSLQESEAAGQSIDHLHLHIIPRKHGDLKHPGDWFALLEEQKHIDSKKRARLSMEEMTSIVEYLKSCV